MALTSGTRLGVYEIIAAIGEGGMGAVYRATDTSLSRQVAIKVLPDAFAADADRLARFEREAKTLASLNHPHIAAIYAIEKSAGITALVMELVEGDDLSQRIAQGAIPIDEALPIAKQIAEALEAAHEQGIIHRDLKPANIKVRSDGTVKVLDFGLAKAMEPAAGSSASMSMSPTLTTPAMTQAGMILGTAAYMAPEQAKGRTVDRRADIWAFGAVLFEMLTGQRAFGGEDITDTIVAVMSKEPDFAALPATVPARVSQVLRVCLRKDAKQRAHDMADVRLALEGAFETAASPATPTTTASSRGRLPWMVALAAVAAVAIAFAIPAVRHLREAPPASPPETRLDIVTPATDRPAEFALSPDGRQIVFVAAGDGPSRLWRRSLATTTAQPLAGTEGATSPFWSPDGRAVGFFADGQLKRIDLGGGAPQTVTPAPGARGGTWNADGVILFAPNSTSPLFRVPASGGASVALTTLDRQQSHRLPWFLPDGRHFLFFAQGPPDTAGIYLATLDAPGTQRLTAADAAGVFLPSVGRTEPGASEGGWLLWVRGGMLVAQRLDVARAALTGDSVTLADPVMSDPTINVAAASASASGLVAYRTGAGTRRQLTWMDRAGRALGTLGAPDESGLLFASLSPDGHRAVVSRTVQSNTDLWLVDGARTSRFTFDGAQDLYPAWFPDGARIVFRSTRTGAGDLYQKLTSGGGVEELLVSSEQSKAPSSWSPDGRFLMYFSIDPQTNTDLWVKPMVGERTPAVFLKTPFREVAGAFSPDGRWVAYQSDESGRPEIYVRPFVPPGVASGAAGAAGGQWQVSTAGGIHPVWRRDGKELYYVNPAGAMMAAPIAVTGATLEPGTPVVLFPARIYGGGVDTQQGRQYDVASDGRFLINTVLDSAAAPITLIQNWTPDVKK